MSLEALAGLCCDVGELSKASDYEKESMAILPRVPLSRNSSNKSVSYERENNITISNDANLLKVEKECSDNARNLVNQHISMQNIVEAYIYEIGYGISDVLFIYNQSLVKRY